MSLAIVGMGMISSVGWGAESACAAIRAGVAVPGELTYYSTLDEDEGLAAPLTGHAAHGYATGFVSLGRWMRLIQGAFEDLINQGTPDARDPMWDTTGLIVITPQLLPERFIEAEGDSAAVRSEFIEQLGLHLEVPLRTGDAVLLDRGAAGLALALSLAEQRLSSMCQRVLIAAVDSHVDATALDWLATWGRLKTAGNPCGLSPGEAAVCLLVEPAALRRSSTPTRAVLRTAATDHEPDHLLAGKNSSGAALARAIRAALETRDKGQHFDGDIFIDLNGEQWRAREWAQAQARLTDVLGPAVRLIVPAGSTGDIGAASSAASVCVASHLFMRSTARSGSALVVMSSEHGDVGAVVVDAARR